MFIVKLTYLVSITLVEQHLAAHRAYLQAGYDKDYFIVSGPQEPRTGGIILSQLKNREQLLKILQLDPFHIHQIAEYELIEFTKA